MIILINTTNLSGGGGVQVADSICQSLNRFPQHKFILAYPDALRDTSTIVEHYENVKLLHYNYPAGDLKSFFFKRNSFLDEIVDTEHVQCVLTVFGPMKWKPRCPHISGFALAHVVMPESPFFQRLSVIEKLCWKVRIEIWKHIFKSSSDYFYTENRLISERLALILKKKVYTVTNYYNQVFDERDKWVEHQLPSFDGKQFLDIATPNGHKNMRIALDIARYLHYKYPSFKYRFVFTTTADNFPIIPIELKDNFLFIGKVKVYECPSLYEQCDISFQPTLLECFTATYPEAMRMGVPIVTTSMAFAKGICGEAALYYSPLDFKQAAEALFLLSTDKDMYCSLVEKGKKELTKFDTYVSRVDKLIAICENIGVLNK